MGPSSRKKYSNKIKYFFKEAKSEGIPVYGLTRNVGQFKDETIDLDRNYDFELIAMVREDASGGSGEAIALPPKNLPDIE